MKKNKVIFKENDGLYLDGVRLNFMTDYKLESTAQGVAELKVTLIVDDTEMFKQPQYENLNVGENEIYVEDGKIGIKSNDIILDGQAIGVLSQRIDALESKVNLEADKRDLDSIF